MKKLWVFLPVFMLVAVGCNSQPEGNSAPNSTANSVKSSTGVDGLVEEIDISVSNQEDLDTTVDLELLDSGQDVINNYSEVTNGENF